MLLLLQFLYFFCLLKCFVIVKFVIWHNNVILFWIFNSLEVFIWHVLSHILLLEGDEFLDIRIHVKLCHRVWHKSYIWLWKILCYRDYSFNFLSLRAIDLCVIFVSIFCTLILRKIIHYFFLPNNSLLLLILFSFFLTQFFGFNRYIL